MSFHRPFRRSVSAWILAAAGLLLVPAAAADKPVEQADSSLIVGVEDSWPPFADERGEGMSTDIVRAAFAAVDQPIRLMVRPYARVLADVSSGHLDAGYNVTRQATTEMRYIFGEKPILYAGASFYFAPESAQEFSSHDDIPSGSRVGLIIGYEYGNVYEEHRYRFREVRVNTQEQIIKMLMRGRLDMAIMFDQVAGATLKKMGLPKGALVKGMQNHKSDIYVAFSRKNKLSKQYARRLDDGLKVIEASGEYQTIVDRWNH